MKFYHYSQNNSGGRFTFDAERGISHHVIVEATSAKIANARAEEIGLYFDSSQDCSCCGSRWSDKWDDDGNDVPSVYDEEVTPDMPFVKKSFSVKWMGDNPEGFIHYMDGTFKKFW